MATWQDLETELNIWHQNGDVATIWWRDDDAGKLTPALVKLIDISNNHNLPIHLAAIPTALEESAIEAIKAAQNIWILQHGFSHTDHAPKGEGSWELGDHRAIETVVDELSSGFAQLKQTFGAKFLPIQVPPWTRISMNVVKHLKSVGFKALSLEGKQFESVFANEIQILNPHCDPIKWKQNAKFKGTERVLSDIVSHLKYRRADTKVFNETTGICTHHLDHDADLWAFLDQFAQFIANHRGAQWVCVSKELS